ncbi:hypothetical protein [Yersinia enterocolitica]
MMIQCEIYPATPALVRISSDHAGALKAAHEASRRGGDSIARKGF